MKFNSFYDQTAFKVVRSHPGGGELITEQAGYVPPKIQIADMMSAGARLDDYRRQRFFDYQAGMKDDGFVDPTRSPNFDLADASRIAADLNVRNRELKRKEVSDVSDKASVSGKSLEGISKESSGDVEIPKKAASDAHSEG